MCVLVLLWKKKGKDCMPNGKWKLIPSHASLTGKSTLTIPLSVFSHEEHGKIDHRIKVETDGKEYEYVTDQKNKKER